MLEAPTYHPALHVCNRRIILFFPYCVHTLLAPVGDREARVQEVGDCILRVPYAVGDRPHLGEGPAVNHLQDTQICLLIGFT